MEIIGYVIRPVDEYVLKIPQYMNLFFGEHKYNQELIINSKLRQVIIEVGWFIIQYQCQFRIHKINTTSILDKKR